MTCALLMIKISKIIGRSNNLMFNKSVFFKKKKTRTGGGAVG